MARKSELFGPLTWTALGLLGTAVVGVYIASRVGSMVAAPLTGLPVPPREVATGGGEMPFQKPKGDRGAPYPMAAIPSLTQKPEAPASGVVVAVPQRMILPAPELLTSPRPAPTDGRHTLRPRPSSELPTLASAGFEMPLPAAPLFATPPAARVAAAIPGRVEPDSIAVPRSAASPLAVDDPTADRVAAPALVVSPPPRDKPAAFLMLKVPQPDEPGTLSQATSSQPDADPPASAFNLPPRPAMAVGK